MRPRPRLATETVDIACASRPTSVSGKQKTNGARGHNLRQVLEGHLVEMARDRRGTHRSVGTPAGPSAETVALTVALELELGVAGERVGGLLAKKVPR